MSVKLLDSIKQQANRLSPKEKNQLANYLLQETKISVEKDLGLHGETEEETRAARMKWLKANSEQYAGMYVALDGGKLVGAGKTIREADEQAKQKGVNKSFLVRVSSENEILSGGW
ncbi:MAG: DUF5678 domain-containing protein [Acidobacteriota bacterium]|nr:DUF5678 domain-containing protein [Acidobacteriota bacterium]